MFKLNDDFDLKLGNDLDLDMRMEGSPLTSKKIKRGMKISLPGKLRKATVTRVVQGSRNGFPDRLDAAIGKAKFLLKRVDRALFNVFEKRRGGVEVKIGQKRF
jgi:hypothetical protein